MDFAIWFCEGVGGVGQRSWVGVNLRIWLEMILVFT